MPKDSYALVPVNAPDDLDDLIQPEEDGDAGHIPADTVSSPHQGHGQSNLEALYHIICMIAGSGVLQLPYALNQVGWSGLVVIMFTAAANDYTGKLLIKSLYYKGSSRMESYPLVGHAAYGLLGMRLIEIFSSVMLLGATCVYLILAGINFELLIGVFSARVWIILSAVLIAVPLLCFRTLKEIAIFSAFGVFASILVIFVVLWCAVEDYSSYSTQVTHKVFDLALLPSALGSVSFSYGGNYIYPEVEASMKDPSKFPAVLNVSMIVITVMYVFTATTGYLTYGDRTVSPILNNLPKGFLSSFSSWIITAHVLLACPLMLTTFSLELERRFGFDASTRTTQQKRAPILVIRSSIVVVLALISIVIPFFADVMTLLGAVANTLLVFVFPVLFDFRLFGFRNRSPFEKGIGILILLVGTLGGCVGGFDALRALWNDITTAP
ncbi:transmembrane amino acid transporter protein-domain-containing protein [Polychytrium aggregatum]|uniref:transmembrane amino acid transporter protein-domain-containing protein n=1 Tax=Polychytrium aggregatum TaxID=110093 RepID=UPI0022FDC1AD|nr:transmembrane amino acid transporter protein-domain-containing protein [Polychytrium aggregatum]KAI9206866.1 transmembrane amino acid transporter protein-domain-containing protein [Polychytrium aggregatum]